MAREMITDPDEYYAKGCGRCDRFGTPGCSTQIWRDALSRLRAICLEAGMEETAKWGHPVFMHAGRNVAIIGAFRGDARLSFFHPALLADPEGILERQGPNTQNAGTIRFTGAGEVAERAETLRAYLREAMGYAEAGILPKKVVAEIVLPDELVEALDGDPELAEAFHALTPGRQRSYVINLNGAKAAATRFARIEGFRDKILPGKGATERQDAAR